MIKNVFLKNVPLRCIQGVPKAGPMFKGLFIKYALGYINGTGAY
jgi:hypothetical protein